MTLGYLYAASIGLILFIVALILGKRNRTVADHLLVSWLLLMFINISSIFLLNTKSGAFEIWEKLLLEFSEASIFVHGPIIYSYSLALTKFNYRLSLKTAVHALPFLIAFVVLAIPVVVEKEVSIIWRNVLLVFKMTSLLIYLILVLQMLLAHKRRIEDLFSNDQDKQLTWLFVIVLGILSIWVIAVLSLGLERMTDMEIPQYGGLLVNVASSLFIFLIGYFGIRQPSLFVDPLIKERRINGGEKQVKLKYEKSGIDTQRAIEIHKRAIDHMKKEQPYLNPELTLYSLAEQLDIMPNHLSQSINSIEQKNFFDFVNWYRIEEVKKRLKKNQQEQLTLLGIALDCGFNSKASFNRIFKSKVKMTPSEYVKRNNLQQ